MEQHVAHEHQPNKRCHKGPPDLDEIERDKQGKSCDADGGDDESNSCCAMNGTPLLCSHIGLQPLSTARPTSFMLICERIGREAPRAIVSCCA